MPHKNPAIGRAYSRDYYWSHREERLAYQKARRLRQPIDTAKKADEARTKRARRFAQFKNRPCAECGGTYPPYVMDFDHRDGTKKVCAVGHLIAHGSEEALLAEIAKCDLVCANCHRERTYQRSIAALLDKSHRNEEANGR